MSHKHHGHHGRQQEESSYNYGAPVYEYNPLQQGVPPYGQQSAPGYGQVSPYNGYGAPGGNPYGQEYSAYGGQSVTPYQGGYGGNQGQEMQYLQAEEQRHRQNEHRAEMGALGAVTFAAFEKHEEKVDPEHAHRHHVEAQVSEAAALGLGGYAIHERHEEHVFRKQEESFEKSHGGGRHHGRHHRE